MIALLDIDIIYKLATCDLIGEALTAIAMRADDVFVLPTTKYRFGIAKNTPKAEARYDKDVIDRIRGLLSRAKEIDTDLPKTDMQVLGAIEDIDPGEAVLFAAASYIDEAIVLTGDKRCLRALASAPSCQSIAQRLTGRVLCLEQLVKRMIKHFGLTQVWDKLASIRHSDAALRSSLGSQEKPVEGSVIIGLDSYITELRLATLNLLAP